MSGASPADLLLGGRRRRPRLRRPAAAQAADKVTLRTNWLFYGSHSIFLLGIDKGFYEKEGIDLTVKQGNGSGNAVRLVANGDSDFAYGSAVTMLNLAAQGAPVIAVATIDAQGTDAVLVNPDSGIKTFKDLEGQKVLTTAGAGVNTLFPVAVARTTAPTSRRSRSPTSPRVRSSPATCRAWRRPCWAGWTTSRPRSRPMAASRR